MYVRVSKSLKICRLKITSSENCRILVEFDVVGWSGFFLRAGLVLLAGADSALSSLTSDTSKMVFLWMETLRLVLVFFFI